MKVFVYGTLKEGYHNNYLLGSSPLIGEAKTLSPFVLFNCGFPMAVPFTKDGEKYPLLPVIGEIYEVDNYTLRRLDGLEGHPDWYIRTSVKVEMDEEEHDVMMYVMPDWREERLSTIINNKYVWGR